MLFYYSKYFGCAHHHTQAEIQVDDRRFRFVGAKGEAGRKGPRGFVGERGQSGNEGGAGRPGDDGAMGAPGTAVSPSHI